MAQKDAFCAGAEGVSAGGARAGDPKRHFLRHLYIKRTLCQDRLGINIGKQHSKKGRAGDDPRLDGAVQNVRHGRIW